MEGAAQEDRFPDLVVVARHDFFFFGISLNMQLRMEGRGSRRGQKADRDEARKQIARTVKLDFVHKDQKPGSCRQGEICLDRDFLAAFQ